MRSKKSKKPSTPKGFEKNTVTCSESDLERSFADFANSLAAGDLVLLEGELGAGKSTFARAILRNLGVKDGFQGSPTFAIAHAYKAKTGLEVLHVDVYRLSVEAELEDSGILDQLSSRENLVLVEWMSKFESVRDALVTSRKRIEKNAYSIQIRISGETSREIAITRL